MKSIDGRIVLITGAASGIGRDIAIALAEKGAHCLLVDLNLAGLKQLAGFLSEKGLQASYYKADLSKKKSIDTLCKKVLTEHKRVDLLINNAGVVTGKPFLHSSEADINLTMRVNLEAPMWLTHALLPGMIKQKSGRIVNIASAAGLIGTAALADYSASKFALVGFTESLRMELKKARHKSVTTLLVCPYYINTGMFDGVKSRFPLLLPILAQETVAKKIVAATLSKRELLVLPPFVKLLYFVRLFPVAFFDALASFFGVSNSMDKFKGRKNDV